MKKFLPIIIALVGLVGGLTAGTVLKPSGMGGEAHAGDAHAGDGHAGAAKGATHGDGSHGGASKKSGKHGEKGTADYGKHGKGDDSDTIYVGLKKPFFAPVLRNNNKHTLVRLDIHLEVPSDLEDKVAKHEPKLRDSFLRAVMNFAHEGGFSRVHGSEGFEVLSDDLLLSARGVIGDGVKAVLIGEILTRES